MKSIKLPILEKVVLYISIIFYVYLAFQQPDKNTICVGEQGLKVDENQEGRNYLLRMILFIFVVIIFIFQLRNPSNELRYTTLSIILFTILYFIIHITTA